MDLIKGAVGGVVGGIIGAVVWALIAYNAHVEISWVAVGIGALAGLGVAIGMGGKGGIAGGGLAVLIALASIGAGKYATVQLMAKDAFKDFDKIVSAEVTDDEMLEILVANAAEESEKNGRAVAYKNGKNSETAESIADYPDTMVKNSKKYYDGLSADDRAYLKKEEMDSRAAFARDLKATATSEGFEASFSPYDILWAVLAMVAAGRFGASEIG
jgi:hypothetical protein